MSARLKLNNADDVDAVIAEKDREIAELKERVREEHSAKVDYKISARDLSDGLREACVEIRRLRRALYKACANWADVEVFDRTVGIDDPNVEANRWALMRNKCLKKAEEYK